MNRTRLEKLELVFEMRTRTEPESIRVEGAKFDRSIKIGGIADVDALKIIKEKEGQVR